MEVKARDKTLVFLMLILIMDTSFAGDQGISPYYGLGIGGVRVDYGGADPNEGLELLHGMLGFEEDGWALELDAMKFFDSSDSVATTVSTALSYRTIERGGTYFKFKYGNLNIDFGDDDSTDGNVYGIGFGLRLERDERLELEYTLTNQKDNSSTAISTDFHMLTLSYLFGGAPYSGELFGLDWGWNGNEKSSKRATLFYAGFSTAILEPDLGDSYDIATSYNLYFGYDLSKLVFSGLSAELLIGMTTPAPAFLDSPYPDEYTVSFMGLYGVFRTPGRVYIKGRIGFINYKFEEDVYIQSGSTYVLDETFSDSETAVSYGLGFGYDWDYHQRIEVELITASLDFDVNPRLITTAYYYNF